MSVSVSGSDRVVARSFIQQVYVWAFIVPTKIYVDPCNPTSDIQNGRCVLGEGGFHRVVFFLCHCGEALFHRGSEKENAECTKNSMQEMKFEFQTFHQTKEQIVPRGARALTSDVGESACGDIHIGHFSMSKRSKEIGTIRAGAQGARSLDWKRFAPPEFQEYQSQAVIRPGERARRWGKCC